MFLGRVCVPGRPDPVRSSGTSSSSSENESRSRRRDRSESSERRKRKKKRRKKSSEVLRKDKGRAEEDRQDRPNKREKKKKKKREKRAKRDKHDKVCVQQRGARLCVFAPNSLLDVLFERRNQSGDLPTQLPGFRWYWTPIKAGSISFGDTSPSRHNADVSTAVHAISTFHQFVRPMHSLTSPCSRIVTAIQTLQTTNLACGGVRSRGRKSG